MVHCHAMKTLRLGGWFALALIFAGTAPAQTPTPAATGDPENGAHPADCPVPTYADVAYGSHERQRMDFWQASADRPTPVVIYIHGGGFTEGDKTKAREGTLLRECLAAGVSYVAINYRYLAPDVPLQDILRDCARAVQFVRAHAGEWHIDRSRVAAIGASAGAGCALGLAFHADRADPLSSDPIVRESTRLTCVVALATQFSYDFTRWTELFDVEDIARFGGDYNSPALYGFATREELDSADGRRVRHECDFVGLITRDAPPVFVQNLQAGGRPATSGQMLHHPLHAKAIHDRCRELGVPVVANVPALGLAPAPEEPRNLRDFLFAHLRSQETAADRQVTGAGLRGAAEPACVKIAL